MLNAPAAAICVLALMLVGCNRTTSAEGRMAAPTGSTASTAARPTPAHAATASATAAAVGSAQRMAAAKPLRLLSYNVLATPVYAELRSRAILQILQQSDADVLALQEVAPWFLQALLAEPWLKDRYQYSERAGRPFAPGGQFILSRRPITRLRAAQLPGRQRRIVLVADLAVDGGTLSVATSHLESFLEDGPMRARQLREIFILLEAAEHAVVMGDLNFGDDEQPETGQLDPRYTDLWRQLRPNEAGFTWSNEDNPLAGIGAFAGEPSRRLDRILLRSKRLEASAIRIIGNQSAGQRPLTATERQMIEMPERAGETKGEPKIAVFPSDHYGLITTLNWR